MMDNDVVVTVGHKVKEFITNSSGLTVRLGDWKPNKKDKAEEFPHIEVPVQYVKIHPEAELTGSLANNVAVLKLRTGSTDEEPAINVRKEEINVFDVVNIRNGPRRPQTVLKELMAFL